VNFMGKKSNYMKLIMIALEKLENPKKSNRDLQTEFSCSPNTVQKALSKSLQEWINLMDSDSFKIILVDEAFTLKGFTMKVKGFFRIEVETNGKSIQELLGNDQRD